jgi:hypothetical protein
MLKPLLLSFAVTALAGCAEPTIEVQVPLSVVSVSPHDGANNIDPTAVPTICFSKEMDLAAASGNLVLELDGAGEVSGDAVIATGSAQCLSVSHPALMANTAYVVRAKQDLTSSDGTTLEVDVVSHYRTAP